MFFSLHSHMAHSADESSDAKLALTTALAASNQLAKLEALSSFFSLVILQSLRHYLHFFHL